MSRRGMLLLSLFLWALAPASAWAQGRDYTRLVVFSDLHLPGRLAELKRKAADDVNAWDDADGVVALGDIVASQGTPEEYAAAKEFLARLKKPVYPIAGNHEFRYDTDPRTGKTRRAPPAVRAEKLRLFRETFSLPSLRYEKRFGPYLLLFISIDALESKHLAAISTGTLVWMREVLERDPRAPTIVFFHAPLKGTLGGHGAPPEDKDFFAQPHKGLRRLLRRNPQVFLWVSGHTHVAPSNPRARHPVNLYEGRITDIHNCDMDGRSSFSDKSAQVTTHADIWTNSLFLYPDRVVVRTFDHRRGELLEGSEREIRPRSR